MSSKLNRHGQRRAAPCLKSLEPQSTDLDERVRPRPATVRSSSEHRSSFRSGVLAAHLIVGPSPRLSLFALAALRLMCAVYVAHILLGLGGRDDQFWGVWVYEAIGLLAAAICLWRSFVGRSRRVWAAFGLAIFSRTWVTSTPGVCCRRCRPAVPVLGGRRLPGVLCAVVRRRDPADPRPRAEGLIAVLVA